MANLTHGSEGGPTGNPIVGGPVRGGLNQHLIREREEWFRKAVLAAMVAGPTR